MGSQLFFFLIFHQKKGPTFLRLAVQSNHRGPDSILASLQLYPFHRHDPTLRHRLVGLRPSRFRLHVLSTWPMPSDFVGLTQQLAPIHVASESPTSDVREHSPESYSAYHFKKTVHALWGSHGGLTLLHLASPPRIPLRSALVNKVTLLHCSKQSNSRKRDSTKKR